MRFSKSRVEFYKDGADKYMAVVDSPIVPPVGSLINIRKETYKVVSVTYAVDHADSTFDTTMRANVDLKPVKPKARKP